MTETRIAELQQLSVSALKHPELIDIVAQNTVSKVRTLVTTWPQRQRKAAVNLAKLRRDFGETTFQKFISSGCGVESVTEQSSSLECGENTVRTFQEGSSSAADSISTKGVSKMSNAQLIQESIQSPYKRMNVFFNEKMKTSVEEMIEKEMFTTGNVFLYFLEKGVNEVTGPKVRTSAYLKDYKEIAVVWTTDPRVNPFYSDKADTTFCTTLPILTAVCGWDKKQVQDFLEKVLLHTIDKGIGWHRNHENAMLKVLDLLPKFDASDLRRMVKEALFVKRVKRIENMGYTHVFNFMGMEEYTKYMETLAKPEGWAWKEIHENNPSWIGDFFVDVLINQFDWSMKKVRKLFLEIIREASKGGYWLNFMYQYAGAKCFESNDKQLASALSKYANTIFDLWDREPEYVSRFIERGMISNTAQKDFQTYLTILLSHGHIRTYRHFETGDAGLKEFNDRFKVLSQLFDNPEEIRESIAVAAFAAAYKAELYGRATGIAKAFKLSKADVLYGSLSSTGKASKLSKADDEKIKTQIEHAKKAAKALSQNTKI